MKKEILCILLFLALVAGGVSVLAAPSETTDRFDKLYESTEMVEIVNSAELTREMLYNRNGKIIIEKCIGLVVDNKGNGRLMNYSNPDYSYISYKSVEGANEGNVILTYFVYNPDNNVEDDILHRFDFIIDK